MNYKKMLETITKIFGIGVLLFGIGNAINAVYFFTVPVYYISALYGAIAILFIPVGYYASKFKFKNTNGNTT